MSDVTPSAPAPQTEERSGRSLSCDHDRLIDHLRRSPYRTERVWLPLSRLARRIAHRGGVCRLSAPARVQS